MNPHVAGKKFLFFPYPKPVCVFIFSIITLALFAQEMKPAASDTAANPVYKMYMSSIGGAANLFNGTEYTAVYPLTNGTPFWNSAGFQTGIISYEGVVYKDISIAYDLVTNEVIIKGHRQLITKLDASKINFFLLSDHLFVRLSGETESKNRLPEDFYDLVYNGPVKVYVKRKKQAERSFNAEDPYRFAAYNAYFIYKDSSYRQVMGKNALLDVFRDKSDAIRAFWKQGNLNFKAGLEDAVIQTAKYYANLKE
ncbi:MAG: hypothetical protein WCF67_09550 [Chitinophagaceae bacterium]